MFLGNFNIDDLLTFTVNTSDPTTGGKADLDSGTPAYRVYEDETGTAILTGSMAKLDDTNTTGFYSEQLTLSAANGFEVGKSYTIYIEGTVATIAGATHKNFTVGIESRANLVKWKGNAPANLADTDKVPASVQHMANDVITAAAHDESTAFPLKSADAGATAVARTGADGDDLKDLSDQVDALTAADNPFLVESGTIGGTGNSTTALHLDGLTFGDDELNNLLLIIHDVSEDEDHARWIEDWTATGDLATVATLPFTPQNATDTYVILGIRRDVAASIAAGDIRSAIGMSSANLDTQLAGILAKLSIRANTAQAGAAGSITLDASASATDDQYSGNLLLTTGGTGAGQTRLISDYVGSTKVASVQPNWATNPDNTTTFAILPQGLIPGIGGTLQTLDALDTAQDSQHATTQAALGSVAPVAQGTIGATGNSTTALHLTGQTFANDAIRGRRIEFTDVSTGLVYHRWITDWVNSTALATISPALPVTPENSVDTYKVLQELRTFTPITQVGFTSTAGTSIRVQVVLVDQYGNNVDPTTIAGTIAGAFTVRAYGAAPEALTLDETFDHTNLKNGTFEMAYSTGSLVGDTLYEWAATVTLDGTAYPGKVCYQTVPGPSA